MPTQLIIFPDFWAKILKIVHQVNYYLPPCAVLELIHPYLCRSLGHSFHLIVLNKVYGYDNLRHTHNLHAESDKIPVLHLTSLLAHDQVLSYYTDIEMCNYFKHLTWTDEILFTSLIQICYTSNC